MSERHRIRQKNIFFVVFRHYMTKLVVLMSLLYDLTISDTSKVQEQAEIT